MRPLIVASIVLSLATPLAASAADSLPSLPIAPAPAASQDAAAALPVPGLPTPTAAPETPAPAASPGESTGTPPGSANVLQQLVRSAPQAPRMRMRPPPPEITLRTGVAEQLPIARNVLNRLVVPFAEPRVRVADDESTPLDDIKIETQGSVLFVTPPPGDQAVSVFVEDKASPLRSFALTLIPSDIPPVSVTLRLPGGPEAQAAIAPAPAAAQQFERDQPFTAAISGLFRALAQQRLPDGYGLTELRGAHPLMPHCRLPGLRVLPAQFVEGHSIVAIVARVENTSARTIHLDESACGERGVLAVAAWPRIELAPGGRTELYIALARPTAPSGARRPSTIGSGL